ncbi:MAG: adenylate/guanylate cyclase domain-containing protein [Alphaproteobacteria bacterium]|nr:adenylate/guanylate cyclase domain-containing protein [Alphaproteobacteria bacterium]
MRKFPWSPVLPLLFLFLSTGLHVIEPTFVEQLRHRVFDEYQRLKPREYSNDIPVRILDIDDESLSRIGQWPWPRDVMAEIVARLNELGASAVVFDMVFSQPDRLSPKSLMKMLPNRPEFEEARKGLLKIPDNDELFAQTVDGAYVVTGFAMTGGETTEAPPAIKAGFAENGDRAAPYLPAYAGAMKVLSKIENKVAGNGALNAIPESDGVYRRIPMFMTLNDKIYPSLVAESLRVAQDASTFIIQAVGASGEEGFGETGLVSFKVGGVKVPTDENGQIWVRFTGDIPERYVPAWKLLAGKAPIDKLEGHIVLIGTSAAAMKDLRATPLDPAAAGVSLHAEALETILTGNFLNRPDFAHGLEVVASFLLGLLLIWLLPKWGSVWCAVLTLVAIIGVVSGAWYAFDVYNWLLDPIYFSVVILVIYLTQSLLIFLATEAERSRVRGAFGMYLSPALVEQLASDPEQLKLGGEMKDISIMFCDVRGFTSISELYDPEGLTQLINKFLTPMTQVIMDRMGTIDKYMGDCIMAFWNAPVDVPTHVAEACNSALTMFEKLEELNLELEQEAKSNKREFLPLKIGIGLNTGSCCVGNMGSNQRFDYSILGDDVNLCSRLEGQSKGYGVDIVISETTKIAAPEFATIELDLIQVKGKTVPVRIFALLGDAQVLASEWFKDMSAVHAELISEYRQQNWVNAKALIVKARASAGDKFDGLYDLFSSRILEYESNPPGSEWDGVFIATDK